MTTARRLASHAPGTFASLLALTVAPAATPQTTATVAPSGETAAVPSSGDAADDPAVWIHPTHPAFSLVIGTDKHSGLGVYELTGAQRQFLPDGELNNVDLRYGFPLRGAQVALVASGERSANRIALYAVDPNLRALHDVAARVLTPTLEIYGCCMYRSAPTGEYYVVFTSKSGDVEQWRLFEVSGGVDGELVRAFDVGDQCEGCVADDELGYLFIAEEGTGIWRYGAEPGDGEGRVLVDDTGPMGHLQADVEGLALLYAPQGGGHLIASSQGDSTFVVYERSPPHAYLGTFEVGANPALGIDEVTGTDGLEVVNLRLGPSFPAGLLVVQDDVNPGENQNFKLVSWADVAAAIPGLEVDPLYDALGARCPAPSWSARNGSGLNTLVLSNLTPPRLASTWEVELDTTAWPPAMALFGAFDEPGAGLFLAAGEVLVDLTSTRLFLHGTAVTGASTRLSVPIPGNLSLCGRTVSLQGLVLDATSGAFSSALDVVIGW